MFCHYLDKCNQQSFRCPTSCDGCECNLLLTCGKPQWKRISLSFNRRQQRAAGLAALELAQAARTVLAAKREGRVFEVDSMGASGGKGKAGRREFSWREAMDIIVKWRQLSEPNDQVGRAWTNVSAGELHLFDLALWGFCWFVNFTWCSARQWFCCVILH